MESTFSTTLAHMEMMGLLVDIDANRLDLFTDQRKFFHWAIHGNVPMQVSDSLLGKDFSYHFSNATAITFIVDLF